MSQLANDITLFCSHDNTGYLVKYIDPVLGLDVSEPSSEIRNTSFVHLNLIRLALNPR